MHLFQQKMCNWKKIYFIQRLYCFEKIQFVTTLPIGWNLNKNCYTESDWTEDCQLEKGWRFQGFRERSSPIQRELCARVCWVGPGIGKLSHCFYLSKLGYDTNFSTCFRDFNEFVIFFPQWAFTALHQRFIPNR